MNIKLFQLGCYMTNCYLVWNEQGEATLFDCGGDPKKVIDFLESNSLELKNIILTHGHGDHIAGLNDLKEKYPKSEVYIGEEEKDFLKKDSLNLASAIQGIPFEYGYEFNTLKQGDSIFGFEVIDTPGHTAGSKCFYNRENGFMITGDTMFRRSYGRYDLPTGNLLALKKSLSKICNDYPENTVVYNAHTQPTAIGEEKKFLKSENMI